MPPITKRRQVADLACVQPNAAGLDIGSEMIVAAVPPDRDEQHVRAFATFTPDLHALVAWLLACSIDTVALESTGVYWMAIYALLEQAGSTCYLVLECGPLAAKAAHARLAPGFVSARRADSLLARTNAPAG